MLHDLTGVKFQNFFELDTCSKTRGHFLKLKKNRFNSNVRRHFFTERIITVSYTHLTLPTNREV